MEVRMKIKDACSFDMANLMAKLENTPTDNVSACRIHKITKQYKVIREKVIADFKKDVLEVHVEKDEKGELKQDVNGYVVAPEKQEAFKKAQEDFENTEIVFKGEAPNPEKFRPLTPSVLSDIKLSAKEIGMLGDLFTDEEGPGLPQVGKPIPLRR